MYLKGLVFRLCCCFVEKAFVTWFNCLGLLVACCFEVVCGCCLFEVLVCFGVAVQLFCYGLCLWFFGLGLLLVCWWVCLIVKLDL